MSVKKKRLILKIVLCVMIIGAVVSLTGVILTYREYENSKKEYNNLQEYVSVAQVTTPDDAVSKEEATSSSEEEVQDVVEEEPSMIQVSFDMDYASLKEINGDLIGWIIYEPIELSYPVVMDKGNDYYEHYSFENEKNVAGAIFLDYLCKPNLKGFNSIIYGHNMRNGTMFGSLNNVLDNPDMIKENPYFYIFTENEALMYQIVSGYYTNASSDTYKLSLDVTLDEMKKYVSYMEDVSTFKDEDFFKEEVTEDLKLCTLSTCHGVQSNSRTVLHGKLVAREPR